MKTLLPLLVVAIASGICDAGDSEAYYIAKGFEEPGGLSRFLSGRSLADIASLRYHRDLKVAIPAAWCLCVKKGKAIGTQKHQVVLYKQDFLGFVSGRLNAPLPEWWKRKILLFNDPGMAPPLDPPGIVETDGILHHRDVEIQHVTDTWIIGKLDGSEFRLRCDRETTSFDFDLGFIDVAKATAGRRIFALSEAKPSDVPVYCVDRDGTELWRAKKIAFVQASIAGRFGFEKGIMEIVEKGMMEIVVSGDRVMLFGEDESAIYLDIFSLKTGEVLCRFTTLVFYESEDQDRDENRISGRPKGKTPATTGQDRTRSKSKERKETNE